jgi:hypothetical protein
VSVAVSAFSARRADIARALSGWLDTLPPQGRRDPAAVAVRFLLEMPPIAEFGAAEFLDDGSVHVDWSGLRARAVAAGGSAPYLCEAAEHLAGGDAGPALALWLLCDHDDFVFAYAAGMIFVALSHDAVAAL